MSTKWQRFEITVPKDFTPAMRLTLGREVAEFVRIRTEKGVDKNNNKFPSYSKAYIDSLDFKIAGKTRSPVNLKLSGDMLAALDVISDRPGKVLIGYENGSDENGKADGNVRGTYGSDSPSSSKARDFMGIQDRDLARLVKKVKENS